MSDPVTKVAETTNLVFRPEFLSEIEIQLTHFRYQVVMTTSYTGDMYPYEWVVHRCKQLLAQDPAQAREYSFAILHLLATSDNSSVRDNCIACLQELQQINFIEELVRVFSLRSEELRNSAISLQGVLGPSQLAGCYYALFRNIAYATVKPTLNIPELRELVFQGNSPELMYELGNLDGEWVLVHLDEYLDIYKERVGGPELFRLMHLQLGLDPFDTAEKLIGILKGHDYRLKDLWASLEVYASMAERKGKHAKFVDFVQDVSARARPPEDSKSQ